MHRRRISETTGRRQDERRLIDSLRALIDPKKTKLWEHSEEGVRIVHLRVSEAERLHGLPGGGTEAPTVTPLDRLKAIGNGWDNHVMGRVIDFITKDAEPISSVSYAPEGVQQD